MDPQLGWAHVDAPYRSSAALDLLEAIRPAADAFIAELITTRTFSRTEFIELPTGQVRLNPTLAKALSESMLPVFERAVARPAEHLAAKIGASAVSPVRVRTRLTNADRKRGRMGRGTKRTLKIPPACKSCGGVLDNQERTFCSACLPGFNRERTRKLKHAARETLAEMRASAQDPAQSEEARRKRIDKAREMSLAARAWEREHGLPADPTIYESEVLPKMQDMSVRELVALTGLSDYYLWQVRKGEKRLHARFWERIASA